MQFADDVALRYGWDAAALEDSLADARYLPTVARLIMPPPAGTAKNWAAYRARFVEPVRLRAGAAFWREHAAALARAEAEFGVPASIVVALIGVESIYGRQTGGFRVIDSLATLAFDFPAGRRDRSAFFRSELEQLFVLAHASGIDPASLKGSYAGAIGLPQFMPGSVVRYGVDYDDDGRVDLAGSPVDAIGSVAHYLAEFGWVRGQPTHYAVDVPVDAGDRAALLAPDIVPTFTPEEFVAHGAHLGAVAMAHDGKLALVELQNGGAASSYVAGTQNFYVITRYNWSSYYAMAVIDLARELQRRR